MTKELAVAEQQLANYFKDNINTDKEYFPFE